MANEPIIVSTPDTCWGEPRINGTRITVATVHGYVKCGMSVQEIHDQCFDYVSLDALQAAADYPLPPEEEGDYLVDESDDDLRQQIATLTREREDAIERAERAEREKDETWQKLEEQTANRERDLRAFARVIRLRDDLIAVGEAMIREINELTNRADRAEAQLAEARKDAERLRAALERYGAHNTDCAALIADGLCSCGLEEALNPPAADSSKSALIQSAIAEDHDVLDALAPIDGPKEPNR